MPSAFVGFVGVFIFVRSAQWGFHPGGWGKPPLDEYNRPLYGDVFGVLPKVTDTGVSSAYYCSIANLSVLIVYPSWANLLIKHHGASLSPKKVCICCSLRLPLTRILFTEEESEEESEEEEEEEIADVSMDGTQTPSGLETPSGMASVVSTVAGGLETPDFLELRKNARPSADAGESGPRSLYQVVPEKQTNVRGLMGSERGYDVSALGGSAIPVLGDERGGKVGTALLVVLSFNQQFCPTEEERY